MITALQLVGLATVTVGVMLLSVPVGLIFAGLALSATGYALGRQQ